MKYKRVDNAMLAYDLGEFHPDCPPVQVDYPWVCCVKCGIYAHIDLVGVHIDPESAKYKREYEPEEK